MPLIRTVETLAKDAVVTTVGAARHPLHTTARLTGFVLGGASASVDLVRDVVREKAKTTRKRDGAPEVETPVEPSSTVQAPPGPDIVPKPIPSFDELPEPIVISAEDDTPDPVHTEPKAASRASAHGGSAEEREEIDGYREEIEDVPDH